MKTPCSIPTPQPQTPKALPGDAEIAIKNHYDQLTAKVGMIPDASKRQLDLNKEFTVGVASIARVPTLTKFNQVEDFLAKALGWKQWIWHKQKFTQSGAVRKFLFDASNSSAEVVRLVATHEALPKIKELTSSINKAVGKSLSKEQVNNLVMDYVAIGGYKRVLELTDSPAALDFMQQVIIKHQTKVESLGINDVLDKSFTKLAAEISDVYDNLAVLAREAGVDFEYVPGYFPLRAHDEFQEALAREVAGSGRKFRTVSEALLEERSSNVPVVLNSEQLGLFLKRHLVSNPDKVGDLSAEAKVLFDEKAAKIAEEGLAKLDAAKETKLEEIKAGFGQRVGKEVERKNAAINKIREATRKREEALRARKPPILKRMSPDEAQAVREQFAAKIEKDVEALRNKTAEKMGDVLRKHRTAMNKLKEWEDNAVAKAYESIEKRMTKEQLALHKSAEVEAYLWDVASTPGRLTELLNNFGSRTKERLLESGVLVSMPQLTDDLLSFYRSFDVGVQKLSDAILTDPVEAIRNYAEELSGVVRESSTVKNALYEGLNAGWVRSTPSPDYIPIQNLYQRLNKFVSDNELRDAIGTGYIHKAVASQLESFLKLQTNPSELSMVGQVFVNLNNVFKKSALMTGGYLKRVMFSNVLSMYHATGSLAQLPVAMSDYFRMVFKHSPTGLGDEKVWEVGNQILSTNEVWKAFLQRQSGAQVSGAAFFVDDLKPGTNIFEAAKRLHQFNEHYWKKHGSPITGKAISYAQEAASFAGSSFESLFQSFARANMHLDLITKWGMVRELLSQKRFGTMEELLDYVDNYLNINKDPGWVGRGVGSVAVPFAQFAINAPGAAIRHAVNNPWRASRTMYLYAQAAEAGAQSEVEMPGWLRKDPKYHITTWVDPESGKRYFLTPGTVDFYLDSVDWMKNTAMDALGIDRGFTKSFEDRNKSWIERGVDSLAEQTYYGDLLLLARNIDPRTKEEFTPGKADTLLGVPVSSKVRQIADSLLPGIRNLEQILPPEIVGQREVKSPRTFGEEIVSPGIPGWTGVVPTQGGRKPKTSAGGILQLISFVTGLSLFEIDQDKNVVSTYNDIDRYLRDIRKERTKLINERSSSFFGLGEWSDQQDDALSALQEMEALLEVEKIRINQYAADNGITVPEAFRRFKQRLESARSYPVKQIYKDQLGERMLETYFNEDITND